MSFLADVTGFTADIEVELIDAVVVARPAATVDGDGNSIGAFVTVATTTGLFVPPTSAPADIVLVAGQAGQQLDGWVVLRLATDVKPGDRLTVLSQTWRVTRVLVGRTILRALVTRTER